jgi:superfamily II DNA or RNA helicase
MNKWRPGPRLDENFVEDLLSWSDPVEIAGDWIQVAEPSKEFWSWWREYKEDLRELGVDIAKNESDKYEVTWTRNQQPSQDHASLVGEEDALIQSVRPGNWHLGECTKILRKYQVPAAGTLMAALSEHQFALDASETGLGKTYSNLAVVKNLGMNVGVVCPANVVTKWTDTCIDVFDIEPEFVLSYDALRSGKTDFATRGSIVRRGKTKPKFVWNTEDNVILIFDEIHRCSGLDSLNAALLKGAIDNPHVHILGLSASAANSPLNMQVLGYGLGLHNYNDWYDWCRTVGCRDGFYGGISFDARPGSRAERALKQIHRKIFPSRGARLIRAELGDQLPKNIIIPETVDLLEVEITAEMKKSLAALEEKEVADADKAAEKEMEVGAFVKTTRSRQWSEIMKSPIIAEKALELVADGKSVVVFVHYSETIALLTSMIGRKTNVAHLVGGMGKTKRDEAIARFQAGGARIILCQMQAGSESIDLHNVQGNYPRASIISPGYSARELLQALGRINRDGSFDAECLQYILFAAEGVELRAAQLVQQKLNNLALLNDGDLGAAIKVV